MEKNNESLKEVLLELLKDFNLKQAEIDDSNRKIQENGQHSRCRPHIIRL